jgi:hypothetical protein
MRDTSEFTRNWFLFLIINNKLQQRREMQKIGLIAKHCAGKEGVIKKQYKDVKCKCRTDTIQSYYKYHEMENSCVFNSLPNSMTDLVKKQEEIYR